MKHLSMKKKKRQGFTLVELLVVVSILGVLACVSVVGYMSFVKKAKVSNDTGVITQINTTLQANEVVDGKNDTPHDAILELQDSGLDVNKLSPTTEGYHYAIDMSQNRAFLLDDNYSKVAPENLIMSSNEEDVFVLVGDENELSKVTTAKYSAYLKDGFSWTDESNKVITTSKGIDVGENEVSTINYVNETEQTVIIRSNSYGTTINIHGPKDVIKHYGKGKEINITQVATESYHEYGDILGNIKFAKGNVKIESGTNVSNVVIDTVSFKADKEYSCSPSSDETKVEIKENAKINTVQSNDESVKAKEVTSGSGKTDVTTIEKKDENFAYIDGNGYSDFESALNATNNMSDATITLIKDVTYSNGAYELKSKNNVVIDLNTHTLTLEANNASSAIDLSYSTSLTIKNGIVEGNKQVKPDNSLFALSTKCSFYAYGVTINTNGTGVYPRGDAAKVVIDSCYIKAACYAVSTNSESVDNYGVEISINNSKLEATGFMYSGSWLNDTCTVMINVGGNLNIENSNIIGHRVGLSVRAGKAVVKNTSISSDLTYTGYIDSYLNGNWNSGSEIPEYPVVIGDVTQNSYNANAICTFINVEVKNDYSEKTSDYAKRYVYLANDGYSGDDSTKIYSTEFYYDDSCVGVTYDICNVSGKNKIIINGTKHNY